MTKLDYVLSEENIDTVRKMVKDRNPVIACIELEMKEAKASVVKEVNKGELAEGSSVMDTLKEMLTDENIYLNSPAIILFNYEYVGKSGQAKDALACIKWVPEGAPMKKKMVYTSAWNGVKTELMKANMVSNSCFEVHDWDDIEDKVKTFN